MRGVSSAAAALGLSIVAQAQVGYTVQVFEPLVPGGEAYARVVTNAGTLAGSASDGTDMRPVRWTGQAPTPLNAGPQAAVFYWMNGHSGDALVGHMRIGDGDYAFRWDPVGGFTGIMTTPGGPSSSAAYGINSSGAVAGSIDLKAVHWTSGGGTTILEFPGAPSSVNYGSAAAINDAGVVVGFAGHPAGPIPVDGLQAFRWTVATGMERLVFLGGSYSWATDVNAAGDIVGTAGTVDFPALGPEKAFLWKNGVVTVLGEIGDPGSSNAIAINDAGEILGSDGEAFGGSLDYWVWIDGAKVYLNDVTSVPAGWRIEEVFDINNAGAIAAGLLEEATFERRPALLVRESSCYPDCTGEGTLTVADFGCFQGKYVLGDPYADCNASGGLTVADFGCFQGKYVLGCP